ncbi:MAG: hypothetical protein CFE24_04340 [Flavobacterium sp. BFFFF2]|nr:MAG: hypothetical protein CFE24_04340 [Flavobacterium sp. BFFFF2]
MADKNMLFKGVKNMIWALPLFFIGPSIVYNSFSNQDHPWYYVVLTVAILLCLLGIGLAFRGLRLITNSLFESNK